ncbi:MAG: hypothetical protein DMF56_05230 [Acidobacteria bacterium]|nr:MAG: hypothetical protein DMF56_05230 [Acidobacteriota bacterium]
MDARARRRVLTNMRMRVLVLLSAALLFVGESRAQSCPGLKPSGDGMTLVLPYCAPSDPCFAGRAVALRLQKVQSCYPWYYQCHPYDIRACDVVKWTFDDGQTSTQTGAASTTHAFTTPGMHRVDVTVTNDGGTAAWQGSVVMAAEPLAVVASENASYTVAETAGSVTVRLKRTGDTSRRVTVDYRTGYPSSGSVDRNLSIVEGSVTFEPGETIKPVTIPVIDDDVYNGDSYHYLWLECYTGLALLKNAVMDSVDIHIVEDDVAPRATSVGSVRVVEGDSGMTLLKIPVTLSRTFSQPVDFWWTLYEGTAMRVSDWLAPDGYVMQGQITIPAGATRGDFLVQIVGDTTPEADETFSLQFVRSAGPAMTIEGSPVTITIVNDDAVVAHPLPWFESRSVSVREKQSVTVALHIDPSPDGPQRVALTTQNASLVRVPSSIIVDHQASFAIDALAPGTAAITATLVDEPGQPSTTMYVTILAAPPPQPQRGRAVRH